MLFSDNTHSRHFKEVAKELNVNLYGRYEFNEASKILNINQSKLALIMGNSSIPFVQITKEHIKFFGYQLTDYLFDSVIEREVDVLTLSDKDRIIRLPEVRNMTGLSRTTLWRLEKENKFPNRVRLGESSVGWKYMEIQKWIQGRSRV